MASRGDRSGAATFASTLEVGSVDPAQIRRASSPLIGMWVRFYNPGNPGTARTLLSCSSHEPGHHLGWQGLHLQSHGSSITVADLVRQFR
jgi:hypothetical protein